MAAFIAFFTKLAPLLSGVLAFFEKLRAETARDKEREIGKELERGKQHEANTINEKNARRAEAKIRQAGDAARGNALDKSLRDGKF
jgi:hypothetical protein